MLLTHPNPALSTPAKQIAHIDHEIKGLAAKMIDVMYESGGMGLAACQIGLDLAMFVYDAQDQKGPVICVNPEITECSIETWVYQEGCLSVPGVSFPVERPAKITINYLDLEGNICVEQSTNRLKNRMFQHEVDHLAGLLYLSKLTKGQRSYFKTAYPHH